MEKWKRVVVKVGSSTLTKKSGKLDLRRIERLVRTLADLRNEDREVILVTSGAIAAGIARLNLREKPQEIALKQACAAVGQCELMSLYDRLFLEYGYNTAQILLTKTILDDAHGKANAVNTLNALLKMNTIPIVNENDTIAFDEIVYGDNDTLSAIVTVLAKADGLILLTDIDGLYDANPKNHPDARLISEVHEISDALLLAAEGAGSRIGTGGMTTKLHAAKIILDAGLEMVIANGNDPEILFDLFDGKKSGTHFKKEETQC